MKPNQLNKVEAVAMMNKSPTIIEVLLSDSTFHSSINLKDTKNIAVFKLVTFCNLPNIEQGNLILASVPRFNRVSWRRSFAYTYPEDLLWYGSPGPKYYA
jgi:hypothetical protein